MNRKCELIPAVFHSIQTDKVDVQYSPNYLKVGTPSLNRQVSWFSLEAYNHIEA